MPTSNSTRPRALRTGTAAVIVAGVMLVAGPALAHVTVQPEEAPAGSFFRFVVRVPNERDDANTTRVEVKFPALASVRFQPEEVWQRRVTMRSLDEPIEMFGRQITEVVDTVTWEGGQIAPDEFDEFAFTARLPDEQTVLEFPALQTYDSGEVVRWIGPADAEEPAARVQVIALGADGAGELSVLATASSQADAAGLRSWIALGLGALGVLAGLTAIAMARRAATRRPVSSEARQQVSP